MALRLRSRHRPAGVADRRAAGAAVRRARREDVADAAVSDQAAGVRAQLSQGAGRSDRLHAGAARAGARAAEAVQVRPSPFTPPILGNVNGAARRARSPRTATNWPGSAADPGNAHRLSRRPATWRRRRDRSSRRRQGSPTSATSRASPGRPFREVIGPGDCCAADARAASAAAIGRRRRRRRTRRADGRPTAGLDVQGLPIVKPPYGMLSAINLDRGEIMWQVPHGDTPDNVRNHPLLERPEHSEDRTARDVGRRPDGDQDARRHGRSAGDDAAGTPARRDAARVRQERRAGSRRGAGCRRRRADRR